MSVETAPPAEELDRVLGEVADELRDLLHARLVALLLVHGDELRIAAVAGVAADGLVGRTIPTAHSKSGRVLAERRSVTVDDVDSDPDVVRDLTDELDVRTGLWVPLLVDGRAIGVLVAHDNLGASGPGFGRDELRLAQSFATRAALAVELSERVARDTLRRVVAGQELERRRLARELHDETGQALTSLLLGLRALEAKLDRDDARALVADLRDLAVATLQDVRRLAVELRPKALDDFGLVAALERLVETWQASTAIDLAFTSALGDERLPPEVATALYRIVQEALTNVAKHANAGRASVFLTRQNEHVVAVIEDDGRGFDPAAPTGGFGLEGLRERVALVGGRCSIESSAAAGTTIRVEVPLP